MTVADIHLKLKQLANPEFAKTSEGFFIPEIIEDSPSNDQFFGIPVARIRRMAAEQSDIPIPDIKALLNSEWHEERMLALLILTKRFPHLETPDQKEIFDLYISHTHKVNSWVLVDISAAPIVGGWLQLRDRSILYSLAEHGTVWEKRIALVSTYYFIKNDHFSESFKLCEKMLLEDEELLHKAIGWMLREIGKRDQRELVTFLSRNKSRMPAITRREAIRDLSDTIKKEL